MKFSADATQRNSSNGMEYEYSRIHSHQITDVAVRICHAPDDEDHPISDSQLVYDQIREVNNKVSFESVDGDCGHRIWPTVYGSAEFYDWLLANKQLMQKS